MMGRTQREKRGRFEPGQDLVIAGYAGLAGSAEIAASRRQELGQRFSGAYVRQMIREGEMGNVPSGAWFAAHGASEWEEAGEGGVFAALWELSGAYRTGFLVDLYQIPVRQTTVEVCEQYGLNPYRLYSRGCVIAAADNGGRLKDALAELGVPAAVIGRVEHGPARRVRFGETVSFMERPSGPDDDRRTGGGYYERKDSGGN